MRPAVFCETVAVARHDHDRRRAHAQPEAAARTTSERIRTISLAASRRPAQPTERRADGDRERGCDRRTGRSQLRHALHALVSGFEIERSFP